MKKLLFFLILLFPFVGKAQEGYKYISGSYGYMLRDAYQVEISVESSRRYHKWVEYVFDYYDNQTTGNKNYKAGVGFKPLVVRNRNIALNYRLMALLGTNESKFIACVSGGFEVNFSLPNRAVIMLRQRNDVVLWDYENWRTGVTAGIKIPLN